VLPVLEVQVSAQEVANVNHPSAVVPDDQGSGGQRAGVEFIVIGRFAATAHGSAHVTVDLDVILRGAAISNGPARKQASFVAIVVGDV
jgi:hypothetical protein